MEQTSQSLNPRQTASVSEYHERRSSPINSERPQRSIERSDHRPNRDDIEVTSATYLSMSP
ncbi:hypothetical protein RRF57_008437 [Xylaria bambusicola]|uniref:Uncharacterized protein n=1 Tax=Xylaria bambusicola TaxID=326684 RepID=A0AAN7ZBF3_9PEZI